MAKPFNGVAFVKRHGIVLASAKGPVPSVAEAIAGEPLRGSWWSHAKGKEIFRVLGDIADSPDVRCFRLVSGKVTFVHRRMWPALVRLADEIGREPLAAVEQRHTESGAHENIVTPYPEWVPADVKRQAAALSMDDARLALLESDWYRCAHGNNGLQPRRAVRARRRSR